MMERVQRCRTCGKLYNVFSMMVGDQTVCSQCRQEAAVNDYSRKSITDRTSPSNGVEIIYPYQDGTTHWEGCWKTGEAKHARCKDAQEGWPIEAAQQDKYERDIISYCDDLKQKLLDKYRKGKAEHGDLAQGKPLDCGHEIAQEIKDIIIYHIIDKTQKKDNI